LLTLQMSHMEPECPQQDWEKHMDSVREHGALRFESQYQRKDGRIFPVEVLSNYYVYAGDEFILAFARDISERKRLDQELQAYREHLEELVQARTAELEQANQNLRAEMNERERMSASLRDTETHFRKIFELSGDALYLSDMEGYFIDANAAACRDVGYSLPELQQMHISEINPKFKQDALEIAYWKKLPIQDSVTFETMHRHKDGHCFPVEINLSFMPKGDNGWLLASCRNIATRKQLEDTLRRAKDTAEEASRAKSIFLANMSHELRTPMNAILGFAQLMRHDPGLNTEQRANLETINRSGQHLLALINDVLEISKIEAGQPVLNCEIFDIDELLTSIEEMMQVRAQQKNIHLSIKRCHHLPRYIGTDAQKLRQILVNLMGNALKFTEHGEVVLSVDWDSAHHLLNCAVRDTGCGITAEDQERIFTAFYQSSEASKRGEGTGLGLTISREYVRLLGKDAELHVDSTPGQGACFYFSVPVNAIATQDLPTNINNPHQHVLSLAPNQPEYRILVVEDNYDNRRLLLQLLENAGFKVRHAANGIEAIKVFKTWHPHLIWMDMRMPVLDGYEATRQIKSFENGRKSIIIALTASAFEEDREAILAAGCDDFMRKPVDTNILFDLMRRHLGLRYIYADNKDYTSAKSDIPLALFTQLPPKLCQELYDAAECLNMEHLRTLIAEVKQHSQPAGDIIERFAREYRYDKIQDLCQFKKTAEKNA
jgi:PAS domain S-box-containing protein